MSLKTRGSAVLDKAQRRLAQLKAIDENLDLGLGLTIAAYGQLIDRNRALLEAHNTMVANIAESCRAMNQMDSELADLSERMLRGVAIRYGKDSLEYLKAGGSNRKRGKTQLSLSDRETADSTDSSTIGSGNGYVPQPVMD
jgi:hypothetical protein